LIDILVLLLTHRDIDSPRSKRCEGKFISLRQGVSGRFCTQTCSELILMALSS